MVIENVTLNGKPLKFSSGCQHASPACNGQRVSRDGEIAVSRFGQVCDFHYDVEFRFYDSSLDEIMTTAEYRRMREIAWADGR